MAKILTPGDLHKSLSEVINLPENITSLSIVADARDSVTVLKIECLITDEQGQSIAKSLQGYDLVKREADVQILDMVVPEHDQEQPS